MITTSELISIIVCVTGAITISYIQSRNISRMGSAETGRISLVEAYWSRLTWKERCLFWTGCVLLISPFARALW
jgi:hypothetical protein